MSFKKILGDIIEEEIARIEQDGKKVRLKTLLKKRILYSVIFGAIFFVLTFSNLLFLAFADLVIYFILMYTANNVSVITALAKNAPDTIIVEIIKGDMY